MHILVLLKFTPLEFETLELVYQKQEKKRLKFTPLEFETKLQAAQTCLDMELKFTPLEFETYYQRQGCQVFYTVKIYSVGV